jgi:3-hydroxyisobutyrate dehydrogenase
MAARLLDQSFAQSFDVTLWNRSRERAEALAEGRANVRVAGTPQDAAAAVDVVISMVADDAASRSVWRGREGALAGVRPGTLIIESSTVSPRWIEELAADAAAHDCVFLDAPVTGSRTQAESGQLLFLAGGDAATLDRARPVLEAMSRAIVHVGPTGSGARLKLVNNFMCGVQAVALAEALAMVERSGLARDVALSILSEGAPGSPLVKAVGPRMTHGADLVHFGLDLMQKDLAYAIDEADRVGVRLATGAAARERFAQASAQGLGRADFSAVVVAVRPNSSGEGV